MKQECAETHTPRFYSNKVTKKLPTLSIECYYTSFLSKTRIYNLEYTVNSFLNTI